MDYIEIGKINNTFGLKGELKTEVYTDFVSERFKKGSMIYLGDEYIPAVVKKIRFHQGLMLLSLQDHEDINLVLPFKGMTIYKASADIKPLENGEYYFRDLRGLNVFVKDNKVGKVLDVEEGMRSNYLRVLKDSDGKEVLVPFIKDIFIEEVDLSAGIVRIVEMAGLL